MKLLLFALLSLSATLVSAAQTRPSSDAPVSVSGQVLELTTGRPIEDVEVSVYLNPTRSTKTDVNGRFNLENIPAGTHSFGIYKPAYSAEVIRYGNRRITLVPGQPRTDLVFRLQRTGTLSGRVLEPGGRPAVQVNVSILRYTYREFHRDPTGVSRFLSDVPPTIAESFACLTYLRASTTSLSSLGGCPSAPPFIPVNGKPAARSVCVEVRPEFETKLRDITLPPAMRGTIRLHVVNGTGAPLPATVNIGAVASGESVSSAFISVENVPNADPSVRQFKPALVGSYVFHAAFQSPAGNIAGYAKVDYSGADVDADFVLGKLSGQIKGKVLLESANGSLQPLAGAEMEFFGMSAESSFSKADGTFTVPGLLNGPYEFSAAFEMPKGYYVTSVRERDRDVLRLGLNVSENTPELEVRVRADGGSLEGKVTDSRDRASGDAVVALVPLPPLQDRTDRQNTYHIHRAGTGTFDLSGIVPGDYEIYAWSAAPEDAVMDPWFMDKYKGRGLPVRVEPAGRVKVELKILDE